MIELKKLKEIVKLMVDNELTELDLQEKDGEKISLKRGAGQLVPMVQVSSPAQPVASQTAAVAAPVTQPPSNGAGAPSADAGLIPIVSPMVGTFYGAASPDAEPFLKVGDRVSPDTVACILEAMKVFNEIKSEVSGTIVKVLAENGQAVEFGQALFMVKP